jgi:hypothetical protein
VLEYRCSPSILWLKDADQTILIDSENGETWSLRGVEAVIWDLLTLNYTSQMIAGVLPLLTGQAGAEPWSTFRALVQAWEKAGILCPTAEDGRG